jgi:hypothetical protein
MRSALQKSAIVFRAIFLDPRGWVGWIVFFIKPIRSAIDTLSEMDFLAGYWTSIGTFLSTGWGTLASVCIGAVILGYSIRHSMREPKQDGVSDIVDLRKVESATPISPALLPASTPLKSYSASEKDELRDALRDLSKLLSRVGDDIAEKTRVIQNRWDVQSEIVQQHGKPDTIALGGQLDKLGDLTAVLNRALYDEDGLLKKYRSYASEINSIIKLPENSPNYNPISIFQMSINGFRDGISAIEMSFKHNDQQLLFAMMQNMRPALFDLQAGDYGFREWLDQTKRRLDDFRSLSL